MWDIEKTETLNVGSIKFCQISVFEDSQYREEHKRR